MSDDWLRVAHFDEVPEGGSKLVEFGGDPVALFKVDGNLYALKDYCPHRAGPLSEGKLSHTTVRCPWHGSCFDITTGKVLSGPAAKGVATFPVSIEGNEIFLQKKS